MAGGRHAFVQQHDRPVVVARQLGVHVDAQRKAKKGAKISESTFCESNVTVKGCTHTNFSRFFFVTLCFAPLRFMQLKTKGEGGKRLQRAYSDFGT